jgi:hypothetical protein
VTFGGAANSSRFGRSSAASDGEQAIVGNVRTGGRGYDGR